MKPTRLILFVLLAAFCSVGNAANVTFNLTDILQTTQPLQKKTVVLTPQSTPRTNATNMIVVSEPRYFNLGTNATFTATNLVYGNYLVSVWSLNSTSQFRILVPNTNSALYASDLLVTTNSVPSESAGYTQSAANNRFVLRNNGWASNLIVTNLVLPVGAQDGYVWTASGSSGAGAWAVSAGGGGGGVTTVRTNGTSVSGTATSLNLIEGTNIVLRATNAAGAVSVQINGEVSTAQLNGKQNGQTNANQFGASTTLTLKDGLLVTNLTSRGLTNTGAFSNTANVHIGGSLDVGGTVEARGGGSVYNELNVFGDINQDTVGGYTTTLGPTTLLTNAVTLGTNSPRWLQLPLLTAGAVLKLDANKLASVDQALTWASDRLNESTNRIEWQIIPSDNLSNVLATVPNNTTLKLSAGTFTGNASILNSNYNRGTTYIGALLANKTNVHIDGSGIGVTTVDTRGSLGTSLYISNCSGVTISGLRWNGYTNDNFTMLPGYSPVTTNQGAYLWALIEFYQCEKLTFRDLWVDGSADHGIWDRAVDGAGYPATAIASTNAILFEDMLLTHIGSVRTNSTTPTTGFAVDGAAIVPTTATIRRVKVRDSLRAFEPYNENEAAAYVFTGTTIEDFEIHNIADSGIVLYGSTTNGQWGFINRGKIWNDESFTWKGTNYGRSAANNHGGYGLFLASGRGWKIRDVEIEGTFFAAMYIGNETTPCDDFDIENVTARNIKSGDAFFGVGAYIGSFGTTAADASSVRRLRLANFEAHNCSISGIHVNGGRDLLIEGYRSFRPSILGAASTDYAGLKIGRSGVTAAGITNLTVRGARQITDGSSAWAISIEDNVYSATLFDNQASGFTIAALTNKSTSAAIEFPEWNFRSATNIATGTFRATNTASVGTLHIAGGQAANRVLKLDGSTNAASTDMRLAESLSGASDGQGLIYHSASGTWTNGTVGGSGEVNVNGEVSVTNATRIGWVYGKSGVTNLLRSAQAGNGIVLTNQTGGTNVMFAIDPAVVASQTDLNGKQNGQTNANQFGASTTLTLKPAPIITNLQPYLATQVITGTGGANTNFTLLATNAETTINGFTNVSIRAVMSYVDGVSLYWTCLITNGSGSDRTLEFSAVTNRYRFAGTYGTNAPSTLTNNTQLLISGRSLGTNTLIGYTYYAWP